MMRAAPTACCQSALGVHVAVRFKRYQHVVSLGFFCSVALELDRYGLRDGSYPFDWIICPIEPTLAAVASYPEELINPATLERDATNAYIVHDTATGIDYYHDFRADEPIEDQIERVRAKYRRRAQRLTEAMSQSTLFVRYIADRAEFDFLNDNMATVLSTLRSANQSCDLMLIAPPKRQIGAEAYRYTSWHQTRATWSPGSSLALARQSTGR